LASTRYAGEAPALPVWGSSDYSVAIAIYAAITTALYHRERTGAGANVGTSLLAAGVWATGTLVAAALAGGTPYALHDRRAPVNALNNSYQSEDGRWFLLAARAAHLPALAKAIGHAELITDPRFGDLESLAKNSAALAAILDAEFRSQPFSHWKDALDRARIPYGVIQTPEEAAKDPQLRANDIVVPLEGAADLEYTINDPIDLRGIPKVPATRAPELGEHNDELLAELGFAADEIAALRAQGAIPVAAQQEIQV
jgi:crotonobetainyl-CoA:carnitine CoA-transferase CaiB-like acyl-CoA transferase